MRMYDLEKMLPNPPVENRSALFWGWNGKLDQKELFAQMKDFKEKGAGGFFMHSREGLETEYLSKDWIDLIVAGAREGRRIGLNPYIYDEDKWPSGMAGGKVAAADKAFAATAITLAAGNPKCRYSFLVRLEGDTILAVHEGKDPDAGETILGVDIEQTTGHDWYSGSAPADNLNPGSVKKFIELTHERYLAAFGGDFGGDIKGFFTDEPNFADFFAGFTPGRPWLPWTQGFDAEFTEKRGYDIIPNLPFLFYEGIGCEKIRHDYWWTLTELFSETYFKQIFDWCEANGVASCGHLLFENGLGYQTRVCGAAMPQYRYLHVPGIDILGEQTREYLTVKQCTSVANQYQRQTISESYGCSGWDFSFEGQKWLWDWQSVMGIELRSQHLAQYSIKGCRKRDYPPFFNYQSQWWQHDKVMEDYCARLSACTSAGEVVRPVLVIHPQSSIWCKCGSHPREDLSHFDSNMGWTDPHILELNNQGDELNRFAEALLKSQCDFDFGDEIILSEIACCKDGELVVGAGRYSTVIVPQMCSIFSSTLALLEEHKAGGGQVIWMRSIPAMIEGQPADIISKLKATPCVAADFAEVMSLVKPLRLVGIADIYTQNTAPIMTSIHRIEDGYVVIAVNNDRARGYMCQVKLGFSGEMREFSPLSGKFSPTATDGNMCFYADFAKADCKVYFVDCSKKPQIRSLFRRIIDVHASLPIVACLGPAAEFSRTMPNTLTLDMCRLKEGDTWSAPGEVWQIQRQIREKAGFIQIFGNGIPMRYTWINQEKPAVHIELGFDFEVLAMPQTDVYLAIEDSGRFEITCNGILCMQNNDFLLDKSIHKVKLENVRCGANQIVVGCEYTHDMELEDVYLCGDFAVDMKGRITSEPDKLHFGDWCLQGYPNYAGSIIYRFTFDSDQEKIVLRLGEYRGTLAIVRINGGDNQYIPFSSANPLALAARMGRNEIEIEVVGSNRNLFGPLHQKYTGSCRIDWHDFRTEGALFSQEQVLKPYGLMGQIHILYQDVMT